MRAIIRRHLFSDDELREVIERRRHAMLVEIDSLAPDYVLNANVDDLCKYFEEKYRYHQPVFDLNEVYFEQSEAKVDVSQDFNRGIFDRSRPFLIDGTSITFVVPFEGDPELFRYRPSAFTTTLPYGQIKDNELRLNYQSVDHEVERIESAFNSSLREIQQYLDFVGENISQFNSSVPQEVRCRVNERRGKVLKDQGLAMSLGFPMKKREAVPQTYSVQVSKKRLSVKMPPATTHLFKPEPALEMQGYDEILGTLSNMAIVLERSPKAFESMQEEDLRTQFLVALNAQFEGKASGETFNYEGKTDILIRVEGRNIFIAECKFWTGPQGLVETIEQLLGYASWRDTKTAILLFNRNKNLSSVLEKIPGAVARHPNFKRQDDYGNETGFRFVLKQKNDANRDILMTVLVFDIPKQSTKENSDGTI